MVHNKRNFFFFFIVNNVTIGSMDVSTLMTFYFENSQTSLNMGYSNQKILN